MNMPDETTEAEEARYAELQGLALDYARDGDTASLAGMLDHGLPVNLADARGNTLLMLATYHGHGDTARMLLEQGADVDRRNARAQTPLGGAAFKGDVGLINLLVDHGADLEADNGAGMTPLMFAAMFGRTEAVACLQARGASLRRRSRFGLSARWLVGTLRLLAKLRGSRPSPAGVSQSAV